MGRHLYSGLAFLFLVGGIVAQDEDEKLTSGVAVGKLLPGAFDCLVINGKNKGRQHCLVCENALNPVVMVFAREPAEGKEGPLDALMAKLDDAVARHQDVSLGGFVIVLSPDARSSATNESEEDAAKLVEEARARDELVKRLSTRAEKLKNVIIGCYPPEGPKGYNLSPKAEITVLVYERHKVLANFAFSAGQMTDADLERIIAAMDKVAKSSEGK